MKKQLIILWIGLGLVVLSILFPPWMGTFRSGEKKDAFAGYGFLFSPPSEGFDGYRQRDYVSSYIEPSRLTAELLIIILLTAGAFYTAKIFPSFIKFLVWCVAVLIVAGVVTFAGMLLVRHWQEEKGIDLETQKLHDRIDAVLKKNQAHPVPVAAAAKLGIPARPASPYDEFAVMDDERPDVAAASKSGIRARPASPYDLFPLIDEAEPPIYEAAAQGNLAAVKTCVQKGIAVDANYKDGWTPLMFAALYGHLDIVKYLIDKSADVNARDNDGETPLLSAAIGGHLDIVKYLAEKGGDVNAKEKNGWTPLMAAVYNGHLDVVEFLKQHVAKK